MVYGLLTQAEICMKECNGESRTHVTLTEYKVNGVKNENAILMIYEQLSSVGKKRQMTQN